MAGMFCTVGSAGPHHGSLGGICVSRYNGAVQTDVESEVFSGEDLISMLYVFWGLF